jgi:hypothetical protein
LCFLLSLSYNKNHIFLCNERIRRGGGEKLPLF